MSKIPRIKRTTTRKIYHSYLEALRFHGRKEAATTGAAAGCNRSGLENSRLSLGLLLLLLRRNRCDHVGSRRQTARRAPVPLLRRGDLEIVLRARFVQNSKDNILEAAADVADRSDDFALAHPEPRHTLAAALLQCKSRHGGCLWNWTAILDGPGGGLPGVHRRGREHLDDGGEDGVGAADDTWNRRIARQGKNQ